MPPKYFARTKILKPSERAVFDFVGKGASCEARWHMPPKYFARTKILKPSVRAVFNFVGKGARIRRVARRILLILFMFFVI